MEPLKLSTLAALLFTFIILPVQSAENQSTSNTSLTSKNSTIDSVALLSEMSSNSSAVAQSMIAVNQQDGYTGNYIVSVDVRVSIKRDSPEGDEVVRTLKQRLPWKIEKLNL